MVFLYRAGGGKKKKKKKCGSQETQIDFSALRLFYIISSVRRGSEETARGGSRFLFSRCIVYSVRTAAYQMNRNVYYTELIYGDSLTTNKTRYI